MKFVIIFFFFFSFDQHEFIRHAKDLSVLRQMIDEVRDFQEQNQSSMITNVNFTNVGFNRERPFGNDGTLTNRNSNNQEQTITPIIKTSRATATNHVDTENDTFQSSSCNTMIELSSESSDTMIINENGTETENDADSQQDTLKVKC